MCLFLSTLLWKKQKEMNQFYCHFAFLWTLKDWLRQDPKAEMVQKAQPQDLSPNGRCLTSVLGAQPVFSVTWKQHSPYCHMAFQDFDMCQFTWDSLNTNQSDNPKSKLKEDCIFYDSCMLDQCVYPPNC